MFPSTVDFLQFISLYLNCWFAGLYHSRDCTLCKGREHTCFDSHCPHPQPAFINLLFSFHSSPKLVSHLQLLAFNHHPHITKIISKLYLCHISTQKVLTSPLYRITSELTLPQSVNKYILTIYSVQEQKHLKYNLTSPEILIFHYVSKQTFYTQSTFLLLTNLWVLGSCSYLQSHHHTCHPSVTTLEKRSIPSPPETADVYLLHETFLVYKCLDFFLYFL